MNESKHSIPTDLLNKILAYLGSKAYTEVSVLIKDIHEKIVWLDPAKFMEVPPLPPFQPVEVSKSKEEPLDKQKPGKSNIRLDAK